MKPQTFEVIYGALVDNNAPPHEYLKVFHGISLALYENLKEEMEMSDMEIESPKLNEDEVLEMPAEVMENNKSQAENIEMTKAACKNEIYEKVSVEENKVDFNDSETIKTIQSDIAKLGEQIAGLSKLFEAKILHTEHEEKIVDQMHKELQKYKEDMYSQLVRPILLDIIEIRDSVLRISAIHRSKPEEEQKIPLKTFEMYASDVQEILEKNNIEIYRSERNTDFIPVRQRAIKKTPTTDENLHGKIAESFTDGYTYMGKTVTPEKIAIYFFESQQIPTVQSIKEES